MLVVFVVVKYPFHQGMGWAVFMQKSPSSRTLLISVGFFLIVVCPMNSVKEQLPCLSSTYTPATPTKCIHTQVDIDRFTKTKAFSRLLTFVILLNASVTQKPNSYPCHVSQVSVISIGSASGLTEGFFYSKHNGCLTCWIRWIVGSLNSHLSATHNVSVTRRFVNGSTKWRAMRIQSCRQRYHHRCMRLFPS